MCDRCRECWRRRKRTTCRRHTRWRALIAWHCQRRLTRDAMRAHVMQATAGRHRRLCQRAARQHLYLWCGGTGGTTHVCISLRCWVFGVITWGHVGSCGEVCGHQVGSHGVIAWGHRVGSHGVVWCHQVGSRGVIVRGRVGRTCWIICCETCRERANSSPPPPTPLSPGGAPAAHPKEATSQRVGWRESVAKPRGATDQRKGWALIGLEGESAGLSKQL
eukprot:6697298-Prymnesium_polylepis.2